MILYGTNTTGVTHLTVSIQYLLHIGTVWVEIIILKSEAVSSF